MEKSSMEKSSMEKSSLEKSSLEQRQVVIVGSGPAGYTAAIYADNLSPVLAGGARSCAARAGVAGNLTLELPMGFPTRSELMERFKSKPSASAPWCAEAW